ncbi:unnamed protein product [Caenorhabditis brenneri]
MTLDDNTLEEDPLYRQPNRAVRYDSDIGLNFDRNSITMEMETDLWNYIHQKISRQKRYSAIDMEFATAYLESRKIRSWTPQEMIDYFNRKMLPQLYKYDLPVTTIGNIYTALKTTIDQELEAILQKKNQVFFILNIDGSLHATSTMGIDGSRTMMMRNDMNLLQESRQRSTMPTSPNISTLVQRPLRAMSISSIISTPVQQQIGLRSSRKSLKSAIPTVARRRTSKNTPNTTASQASRFRKNFDQEEKMMLNFVYEQLKRSESINGKPSLQGVAVWEKLNAQATNKRQGRSYRNHFNSMQQDLYKLDVAPEKTLYVYKQLGIKLAPGIKHLMEQCPGAKITKNAVGAVESWEMDVPATSNIDPNNTLDIADGSGFF